MRVRWAVYVVPVLGYFRRPCAVAWRGVLLAVCSVLFPQLDWTWCCCLLPTIINRSTTLYSFLRYSVLTKLIVQCKEPMTRGHESLNSTRRKTKTQDFAGMILWTLHTCFARTYSCKMQNLLMEDIFKGHIEGETDNQYKAFWLTTLIPRLATAHTIQTRYKEGLA
jgi:hypothetical protein